MIYLIIACAIVAVIAALYCAYQSRLTRETVSEAHAFALNAQDDALEAIQSIVADAAKKRTRKPREPRVVAPKPPEEPPSLETTFGTPPGTTIDDRALGEPPAVAKGEDGQRVVRETVTL